MDAHVDGPHVCLCGKVGTLGTFSGFSPKRSHVRLKRMLRNNRGVRLLHDKLGP